MGRKMASIEAGSLSPSVMSWFGHELETRGIDAVIYTRYILSILQQEDPSDVEHWEAQFFPPVKKSFSGTASVSAHLEPSPPPTTSSSPAAGTRGRGGGKGRKSDKKRGNISTEELRKSAAVECLLSVSDEESGIEGLVEELYLKLKEHEALKDSVAATVLCNCHLTESSSESCDSGTDDPAERYYAAFPALSTQAESVKPASVKVQPANSVWASTKHLLGNRPNDRDSGSSSRDSSGERPDIEENSTKDAEIKRQKYVSQNSGNHRNKGDVGTNASSAKKTVTFDERLVQTHRGSYSGGGKRRRGHFCRWYEDDSDKENYKGRTRGHRQGNQREQWDNPASSATGDTGRLKMKSPRGAASWTGGAEPKFVVPRIKSHLSPSAVKMKMRSDDLTSPLWAELVFSSDEEFDKVISESTSINSVIRRLLNRGKKWRSVDFENQAWYTDPIDFLWPSSPSQRLYKRQSSLPDVSGLNLSKIFEESDQDEGFFGVGEEHQSAALNVIAVLFGTDGKKESPFKHLLRIKDEEQEEEGQQDESSEYTVQFEMEMDNDKSGENSDKESLPRDPCSSENISELLESITGCSACSHLQQEETSNIGASHMNSVFVSEASSSQHPRGDPLYRRRSSGIATSAGAGTENATNIPKSTENQVPDDRPDSGDLNLEELFQLSALPTTSQQGQAQCGEILKLNQSSTIHTSSPSSLSSSSSFSMYKSTSSDSFSLPSDSINNTSELPSNQNASSSQNNKNMLTGSCLNSVNSDYSVFGAQTLPVVVVASGLDIQSSCQYESDGDDDAVPKATFHWTLDDSTCQEDAGEALFSPITQDSSDGGIELEHGLPAFDFQHVQPEAGVEERSGSPGNPEMLSSLCMSQLTEEISTASSIFLDLDDSSDRCISPSALQLPQENLHIEQADGCGESLISPQIQHLDVQAPRHIRGPSLSSDDGEGQEMSSLPVGPRVDSAELRLNLDFILDNSDDEEDYGTCAPIDFCEQSTSFHCDLRSCDNEVPSAADGFQDLQTELKLNLDFIDEEENPGDLSLEDVFIPDPPQANNSGFEEAEQMPLCISTNSLATTKSSICDNVANCESKTNDINTVTSAVKHTEDQNNSLLYFLNGDFGIWSSVLESVAGHSPHHFWPAEFTGGERSSSVIRLPIDGSEFWGTGAGSIFLSAGNPWGTTWLPISPRRDEDKNQNALKCRPTSRLWDVNLQKFSSEFESPRERCSTIENIQHYLMNLRFSGSSPFHSQNSTVGGPVSSVFCEPSSAFISGGIYSIKLDSESSIWALNRSSLWGRHSVLDWNRRSVLDWNRHFDYPQSTFSESPLLHLTPPQEDSDPGLWNNFTTKSRFIHRCSSSLENLVDTGSHEQQVINHNSLRRIHPNLLPSENSAFSDITPPRLPHLPHVRSDPALSVNSVLRHQQYQQLDCNGRKLVQVKSLYKSDNSVLSQLGLTTGEVSPLRSEQLHYSPDTHFKPIPDDTTQQAQCQHKPEDDESPIPIYVGRSSSYQWYHEGETLTTTKKPFIPRFRVNKGTEKYIQTGESIEEVEEEEALSDGEEYRCVTPTMSSNPIELLLSDMQDVLEIENGADTEKLVLETMESYESFSSTPRGFVENSSDYESMPTGDPSIEDFGNLAELWEAQASGGGESHADDIVVTSAPDIKSAYQTIWSCGAEPAIPNPVLKRSSNVHSPSDDQGNTLQHDHVQMFSLPALCAQPVSMESVLVTVDSDSGDEGDDGSPGAKETTPIALETLPFIMETSDASLSEASLQAFLDSGLPGYMPPEFSQALPEEEAQFTQQMPIEAWLSDEDDDVLDLIELRKHWTTPTDGLDAIDENTKESDSGLNIVPNTWDSSDGDMWSFSEAEKLKQWLTFESKNMHELKSRWSDIHDHGNQWTQQLDVESNGNKALSDQKTAGSLQHTWSVDRDLSALWADNMEHMKGITVDHNENPINPEEHAHSWPLQQYLNNCGNRHWLSGAEETIMYPNDWIVDEGVRCADNQQPLQAQDDLTHNLSVHNNNKPGLATKHWSLGDHGEEESVTDTNGHRHFSLQDGDIRAGPWNPRTEDSGEGLASLWINPRGMETSTDSTASDIERQGNQQGSVDTSADLRRIWSDVDDKAEPDAKPQWLSVSDDVFLTESVSDDQPPEEVFTCGEGPPPKEQAVYSDQLEQSWMTESHFQVQVPRKANRPKLAPSQKPCSYFMEGNCRRLDCKFAHDMSSITCRFWEDGGCFKGVTCPFLHGYPESLGENTQEEESENSDSGSDFYLDDEEFPQLGKIDVELHPAQVAAEKRRKLRQELEEKQRVAFMAYRKKEKEQTGTTTSSAPPLAKTASELDKESNEKVI